MIFAKRKAIIVLFFILMTISIIVYSSVAEDSNVLTNISKEDGLYQKCKSAYIAKDNAVANQSIKEFLNQYPQSNYLAEISFMQAGVQSDANSAIGIYKDVISKYSNAKWAGKSNFQLAQLYYLQGKYNESYECYREVVVRFPDDESYWQARYWRCKSLLAKGDYDSAIYALNSLKEIGNKSIEPDAILLSLGECYMAKKEYDKAEVIFKSFIDSYPESKWLPSANFLLASSFQSQGKSDEARAIYRRIIEGYPQSIEAKQAKRQLDSPVTLNQISNDKTKISPQLETPFLKTSITPSNPKNPSIQQTNAQVKPSSQDTAPPFQFQWKADETSKQTPKSKSPDKTVSTSKSESSFSIQVGAFSKKATAQALVNRLEKKKYTAEMVSPKSGGSSLYKVRVVGFKTRDEATKASQKISAEEKIEKIIVLSPE
ncbi:MAG: tetratricopeptide repeat protein [Candidatus Poribacteria bacterium]